MPIKDKVKAFKEAPEKAIKIALIALGIAILALCVSVGKAKS